MFPPEIPPGKAVYFRKGPVLGHFLAREIEFLAGDPVNRWRGVKGFLGSTAAWAPTKPMRVPGRCALMASATAAVVLKRWRRGIDDDQLEVLGDSRQPSIPMPCGGQSNRRLPGTIAAGWASHVRIPERGHLAARLIARAGASIKPVEGGRAQKQRLHHRLTTPESYAIAGPDATAIIAGGA